jgi:hypothetical protein
VDDDDDVDADVILVGAKWGWTKFQYLFLFALYVYHSTLDSQRSTLKIFSLLAPSLVAYTTPSYKQLGTSSSPFIWEAMSSS